MTKWGVEFADGYVGGPFETEAEAAGWIQSWRDRPATMPEGWEPMYPVEWPEAVEA